MTLNTDNTAGLIIQYIQSDDGSVRRGRRSSRKWRGRNLSLWIRLTAEVHRLPSGVCGRWMERRTSFCGCEVKIGSHFPDMMTSGILRWCGDLCASTRGEPYAYEDTQSTAQQYVVGLKANRTGNPANDLWKTFAGDNPISGELAGQIGFQAAGVVEVDGQGNPTGWLFYEAAVKAYEYLDLTGGESIGSPLSAGDIVGVDVVICDKHASGFGMKSENTLLTKQTIGGVSVFISWHRTGSMRPLLVLNLMTRPLRCRRLSIRGRRRFLFPIWGATGLFARLCLIRIIRRLFLRKVWSSVRKRVHSFAAPTVYLKLLQNRTLN